MEGRIILVYDAVLMRPGCALLQAAMGGTVSASLFPSEHWLLGPTSHLKPYAMTQQQLDDLVLFHTNAAKQGIDPLVMLNLEGK